MKRRAYDQRVREVEHATFVPLVLSLAEGVGMCLPGETCAVRKMGPTIQPDHRVVSFALPYLAALEVPAQLYRQPRKPAPWPNRF